MGKPSKNFFQSLEEAKLHHRTSKTYSGKLLRPHGAFIKEIIGRLNCQSILDYGCGKGEQYKWVMPHHQMTLEEWWGVEVTKYDPAWPPFAQEPKENYDLVICTHTLGTIPVTDLAWVIDRLYRLAVKGIYIAEKIGLPDKKRVYSNADLQPFGWTPEQWLESIWRDSPVEVTVAFKEWKDTGVETTHWRYAYGQWLRVIWPRKTRALNNGWA